MAVDLLLLLAVAACWLGAAGFVWLRAPLDRLHCVTFVNLGAGLPLVAAALLADGMTTRVLKIALILVLNLVAGAAISHVVGRAIVLRGGRA